MICTYWTGASSRSMQKFPLPQPGGRTKKPLSGESSPRSGLCLPGCWRQVVVLGPGMPFSHGGIYLNSEEVSLNNRPGINKQKVVRNKALHLLRAALVAP